MNNFDNDMKEFFNKKMSGLLPSEELKNKIMYDIKEEEKKKSILDKIRNFINREIEIPVVAVAAFSILICVLPVAFSVYYKEKIAPKEEIQNIAMENNLSETAFFVKEENGYRLRWFTPEYEIELCGHGTLAAAYVIFNYYEKDINEILFNTLSGELKVNRDENKIIMDFPLLEGKRKEIDDRVFEALGVIPIDAYEARDLMLVLRDEEDVLYLQPNMDILKSLGYDGIMVTAKGRDCDFVSRFFVPNSVINEDSVTGSAHCTLAPYWAKRLNKTDLVAKQLSKRGGTLYCILKDNRVNISGEAKIYLEGIIEI